MSSRLTLGQKVTSFAIISLGGFGIFAGFSIYNQNEKFYKEIVVPALHRLEPEVAHEFAVFLNKYELLPKSRYDDPESLKVKIFGKEISNPIGIAAGFDKHCEAVRGLRDMGFGFVEVGSITPNPQPGNTKPRIFRLSSDRAVINRYGFNSHGHEEVYQRLLKLRNVHTYSGLVGVNLGKNKTSENPIQDYVTGINKFGALADYLVINISSPNTPGLRQLQSKEELQQLLKSTIEARNKLPEHQKPPLLIKLAPDLSYQELQDIAEVVGLEECRIDGFIISNTTLDRPSSLTDSDRKEVGGLSGAPLREKSTQMIADMYKLTNGMDIIGVGGVFSGEDAYEKIKAGAKAVQIYTALVYEGPLVVTKIKRELVELLQANGFRNVSEAVGTDSVKLPELEEKTEI